MGEDYRDILYNVYFKDNKYGDFKIPNINIEDNIEKERELLEQTKELLKEEKEFLSEEEYRKIFEQEYKIVKEEYKKKNKWKELIYRDNKFIELNNNMEHFIINKRNIKNYNIKEDNVNYTMDFSGTISKIIGRYKFEIEILLDDINNLKKLIQLIENNSYLNINCGNEFEFEGNIFYELKYDYQNNIPILKLYIEQV